MPIGERAKSAQDGSEEEGRCRLQIDFSPKAYKQLLNLRRDAEVKSNTELVRMALRVFEWVLRTRMDGGKIQVVKGDTVTEVEIVF